MISLLKTLQWLPVALRIKNNFILRWSTDVFRVSPPPTCSSVTPISTAFRSGHTGLSAPLTSDPVHDLVNSYSSFVSWIKTGFLRSDQLFLSSCRLPSHSSSPPDLMVAICIYALWFSKSLLSYSIAGPGLVAVVTAADGLKSLPRGSYEWVRWASVSGKTWRSQKRAEPY